MFEGIVTVRLRDIATGHIDAEAVVHNSITARGIAGLLEGRVFGLDVGENPLIHVYTHQDQVTPAVATLSGYIDTCDELVPPAYSTDDLQQYVALTVKGELQPSGVTRTITTIGLGYAPYTETPAFAVRLSNPVTQSPAQIVEVTYALIARKTNMTSSDVSGAAASKVSNNSWYDYFIALTEEALSPGTVDLDVMEFFETPDDFTVGSAITTRNGLVENAGSSGGNTLTKGDLGIIGTVATEKFVDEGTTILTQEIAASEAVGYVFNKSAVHTDTGVLIYVNDIGYENLDPAPTAQGTFGHSAGSNLPYANLTETLATSDGTPTITLNAGASLRSPVMVRTTYKTNGDYGDATYWLSTRHTWGFEQNNAGLERVYRLPAMSKRDSGGGSWLKTLSSNIAYNGTDIARFSDDTLEAFSLILSKTPGSTYIGAGQTDAFCIPSPGALTVVSNLGTTISKINNQTFPSFTASQMTSAAVVQVGGLSRVFAACQATGLWRFGEANAPGAPFVATTPFIVAVPNVTTTTCHAVSSRNLTGDNTVIAVFEGGLVRSLNGGTVWDVYNDSGDAGTISFSHTGITDSNWFNVKAIITGPTDAGTTIVALITTTDIVWVELTGTTATVTGTTTAVVTSGPFLTQQRCAYLPVPGSSIPTTSYWMFYDGSTLFSIPYTLGTGPGSIIAAPAELSTTVTSTRFFEKVDGAGSAYGMVAYSDDESAGDGSVVLVDGEFNVIAIQPHGLGRVLTDDELSRFRQATCRPYRHFYMTSVPQFVYFNPFASSELIATDSTIGALHFINWHDYEYTGDQWVLIDPNNAPAVPSRYGTFTARPTHAAPEVIFSAASNGILNDLPAGTSIQFDPDDADVYNAVVEEFYTSTLTSGVLKDAYTTITHRTMHSIYRSVRYTGLTPALLSVGGLNGRALNFLTRNIENDWFSQQGTLSSSDGGGIVTRSELVTPGVDQSFKVSFRVTTPASTGQFAIGLTPEATNTIGGELIDDHLPVYILFTGTTYRVYRDATSATSALTLAAGDLFTIEVDGDDGEFVIAVNGTPLALSTPSTLPAELTGQRLGIGAFSNNNQNRYAYDMTVVAWPVATGTGDIAYYALKDGATDISLDPLTVTIESRSVPATSEVIGSPSTEYFTDPHEALGVLGATDQIKLLPKTQVLLVNDVADIGTITFNCLQYKK